MKTIYKILFLASILVVFSCGGSGGGDDPTPTPTPNPPSASTLLFPENNSECTEGTNANSTQSTITFDWSDADNTDSYQIVVKNLDAQTSKTYTSNFSEVDITLDKGTPYSWYVISKSNSSTQTAQSATWKFYNAGDAITNYTPFPADVVYPEIGAHLSGITTVTLKWSGSDIDGDIADYEVLFGTANPPTTSVGNTANTTMTVNVSASNVYYWRIITTDSQDNTSTSEVFQFQID